jgi:hypothetical protein
LSPADTVRELLGVRAEYAALRLSSDGRGRVSEPCRMLGDGMRVELLLPAAWLGDGRRGVPA